MTKDEAQAEVLRRWALLPEDFRKSYAVADAFALKIADELDFKCYTPKDQLIAAWLIREMHRVRDLNARAA